MNAKTRVFLVALLVPAMLLVLVGVASAVTIVVDGAVADWGSVAPYATSPSHAPTIQDQYAFKQGFVGTSSTELYIRFDTWANTGWVNGVIPTFVLICLDTDNNTSTGANMTNQCGSQQGVDYYIDLHGTWPPTPTFYHCTGPTTCTKVSAPSLEVGSLSGTPYTEVGIPFSLLGYNSPCSNESHTVVATLYFDGASTDPDDNLPDTGHATWTWGCTTTAVTLSSMQSQGSSSSFPILPFSAGLVGVAMVGAVVIVRRRK